MPRYQSGAVVLHTTDLNSGTAINIGGVTNIDVDSGTVSMSDDSGALYDEIRSITGQVPSVSLTFKSLATILDYLSLAGYCILSDGSHLGLKVYGNVLNDCKTLPAGTDNILYTIGEGLIVLGQLNAPRGADATITIEVHPITDGTNAPLSGTYSSVTLPTSLLKQQFTLGMCKVGSVVLSDLESLTLDFGVQISAKTPEQGGIWPDSVAVRKIQPVATFSGFNPKVLDNAAIPLLGKQAAHANTMIQLKKRVNYSTFVADGTAEHILMTMNGLATVTKIFSGSGTGEATHALRVEGVHDGTNVPIVIDTTSIYDPTP